MKKVSLDPTYYNTDKEPLLIQGFDIQTTSIIVPTLIDRKVFETKVNRGVVTELDFQTIALVQVANGLRESDYNASQISITAGGQEIIKDESAERYDYGIDIGQREEQKIKVIINGGQTIISKFELPDLTSNSASSPAMVGQLLAHYTTKKHEEWKKENAHFNSGLGLKRQGFRTLLKAGTTPIEGAGLINGTVPKNQGKIIGFSFLFLGTDLDQLKLNFSVDDVRLVENVSTMRFSRLVQRDPNILWKSLNPGSTFRLSLDPDPGYLTINNAQVWVIFYFDN